MSTHWLAVHNTTYSAGVQSSCTHTNDDDLDTMDSRGMDGFQSAVFRKIGRHLTFALRGVVVPFESADSFGHGQVIEVCWARLFLVLW